VIVSADEILAGEEDELLVIVSLSSSRTPSTLRPALGPEAGIDKPSAAICRAVRGISRQRLLRRLGEAPQETMAEIDRALGLTLGLA